ncbi:MAG TPA: alpha/beta hydrolase [Anaerolineales bacterium]|nr:alpha/beta hydrolase [Anaerolineales bacterium]
MKTVTSKDGTTIAFDQSGQGPAVILVDGALQYRAFDQGMAQLAELLAPHFTVIHYDRRGRGDSTDMQQDAFEPEAALEREIEDLEAVIDEVGRSAFVYGISSGAALAMEAAIKLGNKIKKLAMYEAPYNDDETGRQSWKQYTKQLRELLAAGRKGDAVGLFMMLVGASPDQVEQMHQHPMWPLWEAVAPSLAYDHIADLGEDASVPTERAARVTVPTLVLNGSESFPFMHDTAVALANAIPNAQHRTLDGQTHEVASAALAPVLIEFFKT